MTDPVTETAAPEAAAKPAKAKKAKPAAKKAAPKKAAKKVAKKAAKKAAPLKRVSNGIDLVALRKALKAKKVEFDKKAGVTTLVELAEKAGIEVPKAGGNIIDPTYRERYGKEQNNGDDFAAAMNKACKTEIATGKEGKGKKLVLDEKKLKLVASENNIDYAKVAGSNLGQKRMNIGNILRGMNRRGERVQIGTKVFKGTKQGAGAAL